MSSKLKFTNSEILQDNIERSYSNLLHIIMVIALIKKEELLDPVWCALVLQARKRIKEIDEKLGELKQLEDGAEPTSLLNSPIFNSDLPRIKGELQIQRKQCVTSLINLKAVIVENYPDIETSMRIPEDLLEVAKG